MSACALCVVVFQSVEEWSIREAQTIVDGTLVCGPHGVFLTERHYGVDVLTELVQEAEEEVGRP